ncbi:hypothetical protein J7T55_014962 [Diaporthe amygdali]|uniref:uncharacterized protein n=1 Tax=Phomopsis amygdali TaxID=1214568 RepID=UPI0022FE7B2C|nr:uncharacterized protein J7T55_014962 [Diaporthe amygdali]KAJ0106886.1 hypothetical protein J7T55_014962 [Diaporthe amygdali]
MGDLRIFSYMLISIMYGISTTTILMRIYVRGLTIRSLWWDDWVMAAMLFFNTAQQVISYVLFSHGAGLNMAEVMTSHPEWLPVILKWNLVNQFWYTWLQFNVKMCFLLFYYRLTDRTGFRLWLWAIMGFHIITTVVIVLLIALQSIPLAAVYEPSKYPDAISLDLNVILFVPFALTLATDFFILALPLPIVLSLQMSSKRRMAVLAVVTTGGLAVVVCGLRGIILTEAARSADFTLTLGKLLLMLNAEMQVAIVAANMPSLKTFHTFWRLKRLGPGQGVGEESLETRSRRIASRSRGGIELRSEQLASKLLDSGRHQGMPGHGFAKLTEENPTYFKDDDDSTKASAKDSVGKFVTAGTSI